MNKESIATYGTNRFTGTKKLFMAILLLALLAGIAAPCSANSESFSWAVKGFSIFPITYWSDSIAATGQVYKSSSNLIWFGPQASLTVSTWAVGWDYWTNVIVDGILTYTVNATRSAGGTWPLNFNPAGNPYHTIELDAMYSTEDWGTWYDNTYTTTAFYLYYDLGPIFGTQSISYSWGGTPLTIPYSILPGNGSGPGMAWVMIVYEPTKDLETGKEYLNGFEAPSSTVADFALNGVASYDGTFVASKSGTYTITATDRCGVSKSEVVTVADVTAPVITIDGLASHPAKTATIRATANETLSFDSGVNLRTFTYTLGIDQPNFASKRFDASAAPSSYTSSTATNGELSLNGAIQLGQARTDIFSQSGVYYLSFNVFDYAGNPALTQSVIQEILSAPPTLTINGNSYATPWSTNKTGAGVQSSPLDFRQVSPPVTDITANDDLPSPIGGTNGTLQYAFGDGTAVPVSLQNWPPSGPLVPGEGAYHLYLQATDAAGNVQGAWYNFDVDHTPPVMSLKINGTTPSSSLDPNNGERIYYYSNPNGSSATTGLVFSIADALSGIKSQTVSAVYLGTTTSAGQYDGVGTLTLPSDGTYEVTVAASDNSDNAIASAAGGNTGYSFRIVIDSLSYSADSVKLSNSSGQVVQYLNPVTTGLVVTMDQTTRIPLTNAYVSTDPAIPISNASKTVTVPFSSSSATSPFTVAALAQSMANGASATLYYKVVDQAGNESAVTSVQVTILTAFPGTGTVTKAQQLDASRWLAVDPAALTIDPSQAAYARSGSWYLENNLNFTFTLSLSLDANSVPSALVMSDGSRGGQFGSTDGSTYTYTGTWGAAEYSRQLTITAQDAAGNVQTWSYTFVRSVYPASVTCTKVIDYPGNTYHLSFALDALPAGYPLSPSFDVKVTNDAGSQTGPYNFGSGSTAGVTAQVDRDAGSLHANTAVSYLVEESYSTSVSEGSLPIVFVPSASTSYPIPATAPVAATALAAGVVNGGTNYIGTNPRLGWNAWTTDVDGNQLTYQVQVAFAASTTVDQTTLAWQNAPGDLTITSGSGTAATDYSAVLNTNDLLTLYKTYSGATAPEASDLTGRPVFVRVWASDSTTGLSSDYATIGALVIDTGSTRLALDGGLAAGSALYSNQKDFRVYVSNQTSGIASVQLNVSLPAGSTASGAPNPMVLHEVDTDRPGWQLFEPSDASYVSGDYVYTAQATDRVGNPASSSSIERFMYFGTPAITSTDLGLAGYQSFSDGSVYAYASAGGASSYLTLDRLSVTDVTGLDGTGPGVSSLGVEYLDQAGAVAADGSFTLKLTMSQAGAVSGNVAGPLVLPAPMGPGVFGIRLKVQDKAGNWSSYYSASGAAWKVVVNSQAPSLSQFQLVGTTASASNQYVSHPGSLTVKETYLGPLDPLTNDFSRWSYSYQTVAVSGGNAAQANDANWGSLPSALAQATIGGQAYEVLVKAVTPNGVSGVFASQEFVLDTSIPTVSIAATAGTSYFVGQPIPLTITAADGSFGVASVTLQYSQSGGVTQSQSVSAPFTQAALVLGSAGSWTVSAVATGQDGETATSAPLSLTVNGLGFYVSFGTVGSVASTATVYAGWANTPSGTASVQYRLWRSSGNGSMAPATGWVTVSQAAQQEASMGLSLRAQTDSSGNALSFATGDSIRIELAANDANGVQLQSAQTPTSVGIDDRPPGFTSVSFPQYASPDKVSFGFTAAAAGGIQSVEYLIEKVNVDGTTQPLSMNGQAPGWKLTDAVNGQAYAGVWYPAQDYPGQGPVLSTGDEIRISLRATGNAGVVVQATGLAVVDGDAPPVPVVIVPRNSMNALAQGLNIDWRAANDTVSGIAEVDWRVVSVGGTGDWARYSSAPGATGAAWKVTGIDLSSFADGTSVSVEVRVMNGAGLQSVGSQRILIDNTAPAIDYISVTNEAGQYVSNLETPVSFVVNTASADAVRGTATLSLLGVQGWQAETGGSGSNQSSLSPATAVPWYGSLRLDQGVGSTVRIEAALVDAAGNVSRIGISPSLVLIGSTAAGIGGVSATESTSGIGFAWSLAQGADASLVDHYAVAVSWKDSSNKTHTMQVSPPPALARLWLGWGDISDGAKSIAPLDGLTVTVAAYSLAGLPGAAYTSNTYVYDTAAPTLQQFAWRPYDNDRVNDSVLYTEPELGGSGAAEVDWAIEDPTGLQAVQDGWNASFNPGVVAYAIAKQFTDMTKGPVDTSRFVLKVRARNQMGIWTDASPSDVILVDQTPPTHVVVKRYRGNGNSAQEWYSTNTHGSVDGWDYQGKDDQSGISGYQAILVSAAQAVQYQSGAQNIPWPQAGSAKAATAGVIAEEAGQSLSPSDGTAILPGSYYAILRFCSGAGVWSAPAYSSQAIVDWIPPAPSLAFIGNALQASLPRDVAAWTDTAGVISIRPAVTNLLGQGGALPSQGFTLSLDKDSSVTVTVTDVTDNSGTMGTGRSASPTTNLLQNGSLNDSVEVTGGAAGQLLSKGNYTYHLGRNPGMYLITASAEDLAGNQGNAVEMLRFNQAAQIVANTSTTTPGKSLDLSQIAALMDVARDYPLSVSWVVSGGNTDVPPYLLQGSADSGPTNIVKYYQSSRTAQTTPYLLAVTVTDAFGLSTSQTIGLTVMNTQSGPLYVDEYWTGPHTISGWVTVPRGLTLTLDNAQVTADVGYTPKPPLQEIGIQVDGNMTMQSVSLIQSSGGVLWRGLELGGTLSATGAAISGAERGLTLKSGASASIIGASFTGNLIALHVLGGYLDLESSTIAGNVKYGVKEDGSGSYKLVNDVFHANAVDYYQYLLTRIGMDALNAVPGNAGNTRN